MARKDALIRFSGRPAQSPYFPPRDNTIATAAKVAKRKARRNSLLCLAFRCRGDWIRTSDLLNPIQHALATCATP